MDQIYMPNSTTTITQPNTKDCQDTFLEFSNQTGNYFFNVPKLRKTIFFTTNFVVLCF